MALTIKELLSRNLFEGTKLLAGTHSTDNPITWVNVMEILDSPESVKKGELLVTTGYELYNPEKHEGLIQKLKNRGVSGMAIQPGYYIDTVPAYIIEDAKNYDFPILEIPSHLSFSEILHTMMNEISQNDDYYSQEFRSFHDIFHQIEDKLNKEQATVFKDDTAQNYLFCVSAVNTFSSNSSQAIECLKIIYSYLSSQADHCIYEMNENGQAAFCLTFAEGKDLPALAYDFQIQLTFLSEQNGVNFYAGIDKLATVDHLHLSFEHAIKCIALLNDIAAKRGVCSYENFTFIKMFGLLYQNNRSFVLDNQALQILLNHDRTNHTNYVHTIRTYLAENCNISHAAERLFIHRHTMMNRIQTITDLCGLNFNDYYTRIYLSMALLIHDYFAV